MKPYDKKCDKCKNRTACRFKYDVTDGWTFCDSKPSYVNEKNSCLNCKHFRDCQYVEFLRLGRLLTKDDICRAWCNGKGD